MLNPRTVHKIYLTAVVLANKLHDDGPHAHIKWAARVGGVDVKELVASEAEMLRLLDFRAHVSPRAYKVCLSGLHAAVSALWGKKQNAKIDGHM